MKTAYVDRRMTPTQKIRQEHLIRLAQKPLLTSSLNERNKIQKLTLIMIAFGTAWSIMLIGSIGVIMHDPFMISLSRTITTFIAYIGLIILISWTIIMEMSECRKKIKKLGFKGFLFILNPKTLWFLISSLGLYLLVYLITTDTSTFPILTIILGLMFIATFWYRNIVINKYSI